MEERPRITLHLSQFDKRLDAISKIVLLLMWLLFLATFFTSPSIVPIHFNALGNADDFGNKTTFLILPIIATAVYFALTKLNHYPHKFNYIKRITNENAEHQYTIATRMLRFVKLAILILISLLIVLAYLSGKGYINGLSFWFIPFEVVILFVPIIVIMVQSKHK